MQVASSAVIESSVHCVQGQDGKTAMEIASDPEVLGLLREPAKAATF